MRSAEVGEFSIRKQKEAAASFSVCFVVQASGMMQHQGHFQTMLSVIPFYTTHTHPAAPMHFGICGVFTL